MNATTVPVDMAKNVFQLAYADANWKPITTARLTRSQFQRCLHNSDIRLVIMEACGTAHYWARADPGTGHRSATAAGAVHPGLCQTQQDRCGRCCGPARSCTLRRYSARQDQVDRTASAADLASHLFPVDDHPYFSHQCSALCAASVASTVSISPKAHGSAWSRSHERWRIRTHCCRNCCIPACVRWSMRSDCLKCASVIWRST